MKQSDREAVYVDKNVQTMETVKQSESWNGLGGLCLL